MAVPPVPSPVRASDSMPPRPPRPTSARVALAGDAATLRRRAEAEGTPLVDPVADGSGDCVVTFVWVAAAALDEVLLVANKLTDIGDPVDSRLEPVPGDPLLWAAAYRVPGDWRCSYLLVPTPGGASRDPLCRRRVASKWDIGDLSLAEMSAAPPVGPWHRAPGVPVGEVEESTWRSDALGNERRVWTARTGGALDQPAERVVVLFDGEVWAEVLPILPLLDTLHHEGRIPATVVVMVDSLGPERREAEMTVRPALFDLVADLVAEAGRRTGTPVGPASTVVAGQSLGGLAAGAMALLRPDVVGSALCQSPSLWWPNREGSEGWLARAWRDAPPAPVAVPRRLVVQVGTDEWVLLEPARAWSAGLRARADAVGDCELVDHWEFSGGHDHACWQAGMARGLVPLLAGPSTAPAAPNHHSA